MKHKDNPGHADLESPLPGTGASEALLRAEIDFWRGLLDEGDRSLAPDCLERMRQALALAEYRFLQLIDECRRVDGSTTVPPRASPADGKFLH